MNRKVFVVVSVILIILLLIVSGSINSTDENVLSDNLDEIIENAQNEAAIIKESEKKEFKEINLEEYLTRYNNEEKSIVLLGKPTCQYCQIVEPILSNIAYNYDLDIYYLDIDKLNEEDTQKLMESNEFLKNNYGTPILVIISNKNIDDKVDGLTDKGHYIEFFKENKFIN